MVFVLLTQVATPEWAPLALKLASLAVLVAALVTLLFVWRNRRR